MTHTEVLHAIVVGRVAEVSAAVFGVERDRLLSRSRVRPVADARHAAIYTLRRLDVPRPQVARFLERKYSAVWLSERKAEDLCETDPEFQARVERLVEEAAKDPPMVYLSVRRADARLWSESPELHDLAGRLGATRDEYLLTPYPHYRLELDRVEAALAAGAIEANLSDLIRYLHRLAE